MEGKGIRESGKNITIQTLTIRYSQGGNTLPHNPRLNRDQSVQVSFLNTKLLDSNYLVWVGVEVVYIY